MASTYQNYCEPSEKEIEIQSVITFDKTIDLLVRLRRLCKLTMHQACELLSNEKYTLSRYTLRQYEQKKRVMRLDRFCYIVTTYMLYIKGNQIQVPKELGFFFIYFLF